MIGTLAARGSILVGAVGAVALAIPIIVAVEFAKAMRFRRRVRAVMADLGPVPQPAFETATLDQLRVRYLGRDRDLSDLNPEEEAGRSSAPFPEQGVKAVPRVVPPPLHCGGRYAEPVRDF